MTALAPRGSPERAFACGFTLSMKDQERVKTIARAKNQSFSEFVRGILLEHLKKQEASNEA